MECDAKAHHLHFFVVAVFFSHLSNQFVRPYRAPNRAFDGKPAGSRRDHANEHTYTLTRISPCSVTPVPSNTYTHLTTPDLPFFSLPAHPLTPRKQRTVHRKQNKACSSAQMASTVNSQTEKRHTLAGVRRAWKGKSAFFPFPPYLPPHLFFAPNSPALHNLSLCCPARWDARGTVTPPEAFGGASAHKNKTKKSSPTTAENVTLVE